MRADGPDVNVHIYPSYFTNESRILRIVETLREREIWKGFVLLGIHRADLPEEEDLGRGIVLLRLRPAFGRGVSGSAGLVLKAIGWHVAVLGALRRRRVACVNSHSVSVLPLGALLAALKRARLIYDTHELETETLGARGWRQRLLRAVETLFIRRCDAVLAVNASIALWYERRYRLGQVDVVRNLPQLARVRPAAQGQLRLAAGLPARGVARLHLYQGMLTEGRGIDLLLDVFRELGPPHHLVLMGYGPLEEGVRAAAAACPNIHFVPAVPPHQVLDYTQDADVGLSLIENACLSYFLSLPNKVFEYAAAGVPSLVSDFPEMARFVAEAGAGWAVAPDRAALLRRLREITDAELQHMRAHLQAARGQFDWQLEVPRLLDVYARLGFTAAAAAKGSAA